MLCFKTPLEVVGDIEYVRESDIVNTVQAVSPVVMLRIHYQWLAELASDYAPLLKFLLKIISHKFYIDSNFSNFNLMYPVEVRLVSYLLSISTEEAGNVVHEEPGRVQSDRHRESDRHQLPTPEPGHPEALCRRINRATSGIDYDQGSSGST